MLTEIKSLSEISFIKIIYNFYHQGLKEKIIIVLCSYILSPISPYSLTFGGYLPELFVPILIILSGNKLINYVELKFQTIIFLSIFCVFFLILGLFNHWDLKSSYSSFRAFLFFLLTFSFSAQSSKDFEIRFCQICILNVVFTLFFRFYLYNPNESIKFGYTIFSVFILMDIFSRHKDKVGLLLSISLGLVLASLSFYRAILILTIVIAIIYITKLLIQDFKYKKERLKILVKNSILIIAITLAIQLGVSFIINFYKSDQSRMIQSINKFNNLLDFLFQGKAPGGGDRERLQLYTNLINNQENFLLPHGFGQEAFQKILDTPYNILDSGYYYLIFTFGSVLSVAMILFYFYLFIRSYSLRLKNKIDVFPSLFLVTSVFIYFFIAADPFTVLERGFFVGIIMGRSTSNCEKERNFNTLNT
jgi:hypothetical protein